MPLVMYLCTELILLYVINTMSGNSIYESVDGLVIITIRVHNENMFYMHNNIYLRI